MMVEGMLNYGRCLWFLNIHLDTIICQCIYTIITLCCSDERGDPLHSPPPKRQRSVSPEEDEGDMQHEDEEELFTLAAEEFQDFAQSDEEHASVSDGYDTPTGLEDITQRYEGLRKSSDTVHSPKLREDQRRVTFRLTEKRQGSSGEVKSEEPTQKGAIARTSLFVTHRTGECSVVICFFIGIYYYYYYCLSINDLLQYDSCIVAIWKVKEILKFWLCPCIQKRAIVKTY